MRTDQQTHNLDLLIAALRAPKLPLRWNFNYTYLTGKEANESRAADDLPACYEACDTVGCARGVAIELGLVTRDHDLCVLAGRLGISVTDAVVVFNRIDRYSVDWDDVTPAMVADELEKLR